MVCVCNLWSHKAPFGVLPFTAGDQARYIVAWSMKLAMYLRIWKWDAISTYLLHYLGKQKEMVLDTLVCRCLSFCFSSLLLYRFAGRPPNL